MYIDYMQYFRLHCPLAQCYNVKYMIPLGERVLLYVFAIGLYYKINITHFTIYIMIRFDNYYFI